MPQFNSALDSFLAGTGYETVSLICNYGLRCVTEYALKVFSTTANSLKQILIIELFYYFLVVLEQFDCQPLSAIFFYQFLLGIKKLFYRVKLFFDFCAIVDLVYGVTGAL